MSTEAWVSLVLATLNAMCIGINIGNFNNLKWPGFIVLCTLNVVAAAVCFQQFLKAVGAL